MIKLSTALSLLWIFFSCINPSTAKNKNKIIASMAKSIEKSFRDIPHLSVQLVLKEIKNSKTILLDVREEKEYKVSALKKAIPLKEFERNPKKYENYHIITYCTIGQRSSTYARKLSQKGYRASNLKGGVLAWAHAGLEFTNHQTTTKKVHVYSQAWDFLPEDYESVTD